MEMKSTWIIYGKILGIEGLLVKKADACLKVLCFIHVTVITECLTYKVSKSNRYKSNTRWKDKEWLLTIMLFFLYKGYSGYLPPNGRALDAWHQSARIRGVPMWNLANCEAWKKFDDI